MDKLSIEEVKLILVPICKEIAKTWLMRGIKLGFLGGLTVGWIAGGLVMLCLA